MPDPHIYPDPQTAPLSLPAAVGMPSPTFTAIEQLAAPDPTTPFIAKTMFLRIAMSGAPVASMVDANAPQIFVKADTGDAVLLNDATNQTKTIYHAPGTNITDYIGDGKVELEIGTTNVFRVTITFDNAAGNFAWQLGIWNNDAVSARQFTWVVSATLVNTAQPWIDVAPAVLSWDVLVGGSSADSVTISNKGTGPFTITSTAPALPAGFVLDALPAAAVNPGASTTLGVTFTGPAAPPAPNGVTAGNTTLTLSPADSTATTTAGHNKQISVSATTQALEVMMLLDASGSMSWDPLGNTLPAGSPSSRWSEASGAANDFLDLLAFFGGGHGKFGIARFPATNPANPSTFDLVPVATIPAMGGMAAAQGAVSAVAPNGGTPMGDGIDRVFAPATSYFASDAVSVAANRRWLLLLSDGAQNEGTHQPTDYIAPAAPAGTSLEDKRVTLFGIGYGITGHTDVNHALLQTLADGSFNGQVRNADEEGLTATQVSGAFRDAIKAGITPSSSPGDPPAVFNAGQAEARHFALVTKHDHKAAFVLNWNTPDAKRMRLELITPTCDLITPETAGKGAFKDVIFKGGPRSNTYMINEAFIQNTAVPAKPRYGTWTLRVLSAPLTAAGAAGALAAPARENYEWDIIVDSDLRMALKLDRGKYFAGDPITVSARLTASGKPITGASVVLSTTSPQQSLDNWLAGITVPADALKKAQDTVKVDSTPILVKSVGAGLAGLKFVGGKKSSTVAMTDPQNIGTYTATITDTSTPEQYTFYVTATGVTEDGISFRREGKVVTWVLVKPDPWYTQFDFNVIDVGLANVRITPRDRFGNVLLVDPATMDALDLKSSIGQFNTPLASNVDGSYTRQLKYDPATTPVVSALFGNQSVKQLTLPSSKLRWVDRVAQFTAGAEAVKGANLHRKPEVILGDVFRKAKTDFLALGAGGSVIVAVNNAAIVAAGDNDVTVFVQPGLDEGPYRVEVYVPNVKVLTPQTGFTAAPATRAAIAPAIQPPIFVPTPLPTPIPVPIPLPVPQPVPPGGSWIVLGTSQGGTQSFSLRGAHVEAAAAIRITDLSRKTRGLDLKPLATPGVCIRGVGVLKVSDQIPWGLATHLLLLERPSVM